MIEVSTIRTGRRRGAGHGLTEDAEVRRCHGPAGSPRTAPRIPAGLVLVAAELVAVGCPDDGRCHLVDENHFAAELLGASGRPTVRTLCLRRVLPDSLLVAPRPACPACLRAGQPRICDVLAPTPVRGDGWWGAVERASAVALGRLHAVLTAARCVPPGAGRHAAAGGPSCP